MSSTRAAMLLCVAIPTLGLAQSAPRRLDRLLTPIVASARVPAMGAAVVSPQGVVAIGVAGVRAQGSPGAVAVTDRWHLGSCTKAMTAVLVARLVDRGVVRWESTVAELWPEASRHAGWNRVTLSQLLAHRSGMRANAPDSLWQAVATSGAPVTTQRATLARAFFADAPSAPVDSVTVYSNAAYLAVGALIERRTGRSWESLMQQHVFTPLRMQSAGFGAPGPRTQARGHVEDSTGVHPVPWGPGADNPAVTGPAGAVHASLGDWGNFVAAILRGARGDTTYLSRAQWHALLTPANTRAAYVMGWKLHADSTVSFPLDHVGSNGFWIVQASLAPSAGYAVLVTANLSADRLEQPFKQVTRALRDSARSWCANGRCR